MVLHPPGVWRSRTPPPQTQRGARTSEPSSSPAIYRARRHTTSTPHRPTRTQQAAYRQGHTTLTPRTHNTHRPHTVKTAQPATTAPTPQHNAQKATKPCSHEPTRAHPTPHTHNTQTQLGGAHDVRLTRYFTLVSHSLQYTRRFPDSSLESFLAAGSVSGAIRMPHPAA